MLGKEAENEKETSPVRPIDLNPPAPLQIRKANEPKEPEIKKPQAKKRTAKKKDEPVVIDDGPIISPASLARARATTTRNQLASFCRYIRTPHTYMMDCHLDKFIDVANRALPARSNMITTLAAQRLEHYEPLPGQELVDDVQILYVGQVDKKFKKKIRHIGHYVCVHYSANDRHVYVYDSLYKGIEILLILSKYYQI